jgi:hypothetical protein
MTWTTRQRAMLEDMGLRVWVVASAFDARADAFETDEDGSAATAAGSDGAVERVGQAGSAAVSPALVAPLDATQGERPQVIATMDWPALRDAVAACTACGLCRNRTHTVFGIGNTRAH